MSLNTRILLGAILGLGLGFILIQLDISSALYQWTIYACSLISGVFVSLLKMIVVPLIFTSIVVGVAQLRMHQQIHRVWMVTVVFYTFTATVAIALGIFSIHVFKPGAGLELSMFQDSVAQMNTIKLSLPEFFSKFFTDLFSNPVTAMAQGNIIAVVMFALLMGIALVSGAERYHTVLSLMEELFALMMLMVNWIMQIAPYGVFALLVKLVATQNATLLIGLGKFIAVVVGTTVFHGAVVLPLLVYFLANVSPLQLWRGARPALITAFATSSSSATLPVTLNCLQDMKVPGEIANFVAPVGAQVNMDGTALYEAAAALFVASLVGIDLSLGQQLIVCLTAMIAAIGAPGIPSAGMVTMVMVLQSVGLPAEAIAILLPIDRLLDTVRTVVNVEGDFAGALVVQKFSSPPTGETYVKRI
jgi:Na+/H+-dicarboxylate symporter